MLQGKSATAVHRDSSGESLVATGSFRFNLKALQDPRMEENNLKMILNQLANAGVNSSIHLGEEPEGEWFGVFEFDV